MFLMCLFMPVLTLSWNHSAQAHFPYAPFKQKSRKDNSLFLAFSIENGVVNWKYKSEKECLEKQRYHYFQKASVAYTDTRYAPISCRCSRLRQLKILIVAALTPVRSYTSPCSEMLSAKNRVYLNGPTQLFWYQEYFFIIQIQYIIRVMIFFFTLCYICRERRYTYHPSWWAVGCDKQAGSNFAHKFCS